MLIILIETRSEKISKKRRDEYYLHSRTHFLTMRDLLLQSNVVVVVAVAVDVMIYEHAVCLQPTMKCPSKST